jgi:hypothetical protein
MNHMTKYLLACCDESDRREAARLKELKEKRAKCEHKELSRPVHIGMGCMSQHCINCGEDFGYHDRD